MMVMIVSSLIFLGALGMIFSEKLNRTIAALAGAVLMLVAGKILGFYTQMEAVTAIDWNTLGLLLGMMILVALLEPTGFFQYLAVWAGRLSRGKPILLLVLLGSVTTLLSMFLDNVTTVVLIAPVTILICEVLGLQTIPFLIAEALLSNTGGVATLVGDPPNILIASAAGLSFVDFITHSMPVVVVCWLAALLVLTILFRRELSIQPLSQEALLSMSPTEALNDRKTAIRCLIVLGGAILLFFFQDPLGVSPSLIALGAAAFALVWVRPPIHEILRGVEWSVLLFFIGLFVMVGGLEKAGSLHVLANLITHLSGVPPMLLGVAVIWLVALLSAVVDNVPITIALIPVIIELGQNGMNATPLWWALVFGAGFGGNGTIVGSSANIVVATLSEKTRTPITTAIWNRRGLPVMLLTCVIASILFVLAYPILTR